MRTVHRYASILLLSIFFLFLFLEELNLGKGYIYLANQYSNEVIREITVIREKKENIGIVIVVQRASDEQQYGMALDTVRCYATHFGYGIHVIHVESEKEIAKKCQQEDLMFRRHCVLSLKMPTLSESWLLFLDGDMGIINPNHLIEPFIPQDSRTQIVFYNRIMNHEVMAGSYLVKNSQWSRDFLMFWAEYEQKLPNSFHGSDNGALHSVILEKALPNLKAERQFCEKRFWETSKDYEDLSTYEVCAQNLLQKNRGLPEIRILKKGRFAWARDGWLTKSTWSDTDFIFHGWQRRRQDKLMFAMWHSPIVYENPFNLTLCSIGRAHENWRYKNSFMGSVIDVDRQLLGTIEQQKQSFDKRSQMIARYQQS